jgi:hypothetical protein
MSRSAKIAYASLIGLMGLIVLLVGIFTPLSFGIALIIAMACWVGSGILAKYWEVKKWEKDSDRLRFSVRPVALRLGGRAAATPAVTTYREVGLIVRTDQ